MLSRSRLPLLLALALVLPALAEAASIPSSGVQITTAANYSTSSGATQAGPSPGTTSSGLTDFEGALAQGAGAPPGPVRAYAHAGGVGGVSPVNASATVRQVSNWQPAGASGNVDVDLNIFLDGTLEMDFFGNSTPGSIQATVDFVVEVITETGGAFEVFRADAVLGNDTLPDVTFGVSGDWSLSDWNLVEGGFGGTKGVATLNFATVVNDALLIGPSELFAVRTTLTAVADTGSAGEKFARSDFFNTGNVTVSSDAPGVSFTFVVPEPGVSLLLGTALLALAGVGRRR